MGMNQNLFDSATDRVQVERYPIQSNRVTVQVVDWKILSMMLQSM